MSCCSYCAGISDTVQGNAGAPYHVVIKLHGLIVFPEANQFDRHDNGIGIKVEYTAVSERGRI